MDISSENLELVTYKHMGEKYACFLIIVCVCVNLNSSVIFVGKNKQ